MCFLPFRDMIIIVLCHGGVFCEHLGQDMPQKRPRCPYFPCQHHVNTMSTHHFRNTSVKKYHKNVQGVHVFHVNTMSTPHFRNTSVKKYHKNVQGVRVFHVNTMSTLHFKNTSVKKYHKNVQGVHVFHVNTMSIPCQHLILGTTRCKQVYLSQDFIENRFTNRRANGNFEYICLI